MDKQKNVDLPITLLQEGKHELSPSFERAETCHALSRQCASMSVTQSQASRKP